MGMIKLCKHCSSPFPDTFSFVYSRSDNVLGRGAVLTASRLSILRRSRFLHFSSKFMFSEQKQTRILDVQRVGSTQHARSIRADITFPGQPSNDLISCGKRSVDALSIHKYGHEILVRTGNSGRGHLASFLVVIRTRLVKRQCRRLEGCSRLTSLSPCPPSHGNNIPNIREDTF